MSRPPRRRSRVCARPGEQVDPTLLKLVLTPSLIALATLLGRRFGQAFAGWLVGFPFTSGPVSLFLAVEHGTGFAAAAALGSIASVVAQATFALAYARLATRGWLLALLGATVSFAVVGVALRLATLDAMPAAVVAWLVLALVARLMPLHAAAGTASPSPRWDLPGRMTVATALVLGLTAAAPALGPFTSGVVSGFPLYASVLAVFAQRGSGAAAAVAVMRGLGVGLFAFAAFFLVITTAIVPLGIAAAFALATAVILVVQGVSFAILRRSA